MQFKCQNSPISTQFSSIWPIDRTLSGTTTLGQSGPGSDGNERVLRISPKLQHYSNLTIRLSYPGHSLGGSYPSAEKQLMYSTTQLTGQMFMCMCVCVCVYICNKM